MTRDPGAEPSAVRVLVIGCGFVGGHVATGLALRGFGVTVLSRSFGPALVPARHRVVLIEADARDRRVLARALRGTDEVVYCIGGLQPASAERNPALDARMLLDPLRTLLSILRPHRQTGVTFLSSGGAIYGNPRRLPVDERHPAAPIGAYAAARLGGESLLAGAPGPARVLRCANVYGEHQPLDRGQGAVGVFIDRVARGRPIALYGNGEAVRDYVYVGDLVEVLAHLLAGPRDSLLLNVGSGTGTSLLDLLDLVERVVGRRPIIVRRPARPFDVRRVILDVTRLRGLMAFNPLPLADGVALVARWMRSVSSPRPDATRRERSPALAR
jgi:UDP-glucose 4-epimerase